ncbi:MAG: LytTR family transcriptional regulator DNA-binding domain-containing protein [Chitinophagaceae bacterium]|nr:LytTR family transcriptional regulator DNA-binding domain-containing protein [Chitinophagaceae bacterium]
MARANTNTTRNKKTTVTAICIPMGDEMLVIFFDDIDYIQADNNCCKIYCSGESRPYLTRIPLKEIFTLLPSQLFSRIHDSYIVADGIIRKFNRHRTRVGIKNDIWLPVGRKYLPQLIERFPAAIAKSKSE